MLLWQRFWSVVCGGAVWQYLQQLHLKVAVHALHVAQNPLPVRTARSQHLLHCLLKRHIYEHSKQKSVSCVRKMGNWLKHKVLPETAQSQRSLLFWTLDWDSLSTMKEVKSISLTQTSRFVPSVTQKPALPCSRGRGCCKGYVRGGRCGRRHRTPGRRPSCCWSWWCQCSAWRGEDTKIYYVHYFSVKQVYKQMCKSSDTLHMFTDY